MSEELKLCPFCGEEELTNNATDDGYVVINCLGCGVIGPWGGTKEEAKELWNKRRKIPREWVRQKAMMFTPCAAPDTMRKVFLDRFIEVLEEAGVEVEGEG